MLALIIAMIICVALGAGVVGFVMIEARRDGRGEFWTAEGEELIAGVRRTSEKVRERGSRLGSSAAGRAQAMRERRSVPGTHAAGRSAAPQANPSVPSDSSASPDPSDQPDEDLRTAS